MKKYFNDYYQLHRLDGPAVTHQDGTQEWWLDGYLHRTDGPAIIRPSGGQEWWLYAYRHRTDGPAVVYPDGRQEWWINGNLVDQLTLMLLKHTSKDVV